MINSLKKQPQLELSRYPIFAYNAYAVLHGAEKQWAQNGPI